MPLIWRSRRDVSWRLVGPSGSGKSTLLNIVGLLDRPTSGKLSIGGQDTGRLDDAAITHLRGRSIGSSFGSYADFGIHGL